MDEGTCLTFDGLAELQDIQMAKRRNKNIDRKAEERRKKWQKPKEGHIKMKTDGSWNEKTHGAGMGYMLVQLEKPNWTESKILV